MFDDIKLDKEQKVKFKCSKYRLLSNDTKIIGHRTLYRVVRNSDNLIGGYIESGHNLSGNGSCFVYDEACVYGKARVYGKACVYSNTNVSDEARVYGNACVYGEARVFGEARVYGNARVYGKAWVYSRAHVFGESRVFGEARVSGKARVYSRAHVFGNSLSTKLVQNCLIFKHSITVTDNNISIGCENHSKEHWEKNIDNIGKDNGYNDNEITAIKHILKGLIIMEEENA